MGLRNQYVATGYVYDGQSDQFLLIYHKKLGKWLAPGGHLNDGEEPHEGVLRELLEETGQRGRFVDLLEMPKVGTSSVPQLPAPFCILYETIPASAFDDEHMHVDFVYVLEIESPRTLKLHLQEVEQAKWIAAEEVASLDTFENTRQVCRAISKLHKEKGANSNPFPPAAQAPRRG